MNRMKKIFLLALMLGLLSALAGFGVGNSCYQVNNTPCSPNGSTRTCVLVAGGHPVGCNCLAGRWDCPVEP